jgi:hypothetical protein
MEPNFIGYFHELELHMLVDSLNLHMLIEMHKEHQ